MTKTSCWAFEDAAEATAFLDDSFKEYRDTYTKEDLFRMLQEVAEEGNPIMQQFLGLCYAIGYGCEENPAEAVNWFKKSAEQGCDDAQMMLGECYCCGHGVKKDYETAFEWYMKAAGNGNPKAKSILSQILMWN